MCFSRCASSTLKGSTVTVTDGYKFSQIMKQTKSGQLSQTVSWITIVISSASYNLINLSGLRCTLRCSFHSLNTSKDCMVGRVFNVCELKETNRWWSSWTVSCIHQCHYAHFLQPGLVSFDVCFPILHLEHRRVLRCRASPNSASSDKRKPGRCHWE